MGKCVRNASIDISGMLVGCEFIHTFVNYAMLLADELFAANVRLYDGAKKRNLKINVSVSKVLGFDRENGMIGICIKMLKKLNR